MNHFTLLGLIEDFNVDDAALQMAYFAAQRQYHPDRFVNKSAEEKLAAAQKSADINEAYNTLKDPLARAKHLLTLQGIAVDDIKPSPALLMEIMELQEDGGDVAALRKTCLQALADAFASKDIASAQALTTRLSYLRKL